MFGLDWRTVSSTVLIAAPEHLQILKAREDLANAQAFPDAEALRALDVITRQRPDVVALDISMPVMDGFEAAAELERFDDPPAVLMLTGSNAPADIDRARRVGAKGYITKDAIAASLVEAILAAAR